MIKNKPAFPIVFQDGAGGYHEGLTKKEYFAGLAMQAIISKYSLNLNEEAKFEQIAIDSNIMAEYLIDELEGD